jgi:hypothetical protein
MQNNPVKFEMEHRTANPLECLEKTGNYEKFEIKMLLLQPDK